MVRNAFDIDAPAGRPRHAPGARARRRDRLVLQPTRAIPRKNVAGGIALAERLGATFWLLGPAEDGYGPELERLLAAAGAPVVLGPGPDGAGADVADAYAACDLVVLPSTWEGFGNPPSSRPCTAGPWPSARTRWRPNSPPSDSGGSPTTTHRALAAFLDAPDVALLEHNHLVARRHFSLARPPRAPRAGPRAGPGGHPVAVSPGPGSDPAGTLRRWRPVLPGPGTAAKRLPADRRRQQLLDVALSSSPSGASTPPPWTTSPKPPASRSRCSTSTSHPSVPCTWSSSTRCRTPCSRPSARPSPPAGGPRQQVEGGFAAYFHLVVSHADAFHLLFGSDVPNDPELSRAVRKVEDSIAESIDVLIDAGLDEDHRRLLAFAVVGMAEGASRHFLAARDPVEGDPHESEATRLARRLADLAWAGLRSVHPD